MFLPRGRTSPSTIKHTTPAYRMSTAKAAKNPVRPLVLPPMVGTVPVYRGFLGFIAKHIDFAER